MNACSFGRLPEGYKKILAFNLKEDKSMLRKIYLLSVLLLAVSIAGVLQFAIQRFSSVEFEFRLAGAAVFLALIILSQVVTVVLHELTHAVAFRFFSNGKIQFGLLPKQMVAYAACPDTYFSRNAYTVVALAPLTALSALFAAALCFTTGWMYFFFAAVFVMNFSGAAGDLYFAWVLRRYPSSALVEDRADNIAIFVKESPHG